MLTLERRKKILQWIKQNGRAEVGELAATFGVSPMTIRRDLRHLEEEGHLLRARGGALAKDSFIDEIPYRSKVSSNIELKRLIAQEACSLIKDGDSVILDAGSTTLEIAKCLKKTGKNLTVVTNDLNIALELADTANINVFTTGGKVQPGLYCLLGEEAINFIKSVNVNIAFLGAAAIDSDLELYTPTLEKAHLKRTMITSAAKSVVVADHTKFGHRAFAKVCSLDSVDALITDDGISEELKTKVEDLKIEVILCPAKSYVTGKGNPKSQGCLHHWR